MTAQHHKHQIAQSPALTTRLQEVGGDAAAIQRAVHQASERNLAADREALEAMARGSRRQAGIIDEDDESGTHHDESAQPRRRSQGSRAARHARAPGGVATRSRRRAMGGEEVSFNSKAGQPLSQMQMEPRAIHHD